MGQICCNPRSEEKYAIDVPQVDNCYVDEPTNDNSKNAYIETNSIMICSNKSTNEINYKVKYKPKLKK